MIQLHCSMTIPASQKHKISRLYIKIPVQVAPIPCSVAAVQHVVTEQLLSCRYHLLELPQVEIYTAFNDEGACCGVTGGHHQWKNH